MKFGTHTGGAAGEVCHLWLPCSIGNEWFVCGDVSGVLAQVDHALATEEQERMKKIAEKELEIVKADLRLVPYSHADSQC